MFPSFFNNLTFFHCGSKEWDTHSVYIVPRYHKWYNICRHSLAFLLFKWWRACTLSTGFYQRQHNKNIQRKFSHIQSFKSHPCTRQNGMFLYMLLFFLVVPGTNYTIKMLRTSPARQSSLFYGFWIVIFILCAVPAMWKITHAIFQCNASFGEALCSLSFQKWYKHPGRKYHITVWFIHSHLFIHKATYLCERVERLSLRQKSGIAN